MHPCPVSQPDSFYKERLAVTALPLTPSLKGGGITGRGFAPPPLGIRKLSASAVLRTAMLVWGQSVANVPHLRENMKQAPLAVSKEGKALPLLAEWQEGHCGQMIQAPSS